ncbi:MAG TPA: sugar phosphate isomerase/epimerase family protein [Blastocatellia bacterium]|jgi:hydroxypyruvate isomerase|nr:sugar phosphate isomerase/epimerase family protein [Blastocatellia bacterium]
MANMTRRDAIVNTGAAAVGSILLGRTVKAGQASGRVVKNGRLKQSVSRWCYQKIALPDFCRAVADMGLTAIDLLKEDEWETVREYGLICSMGYGGGGSIPDGLNVKANHDAIVKNFEKSIPHAAKAGVPNVITFFGNRRGMSDSEASANCIEGLNRVKKIAEDNGVTICVELLNSKVDHKDYQGDRTSFGVEVVRAVASPRVKLLYDIYHMQIMEGDLIRTIQKNHEYIGHFHTGGVPGRHELDGSQEVNWAAVCSAIAGTGFKGYVAHEFVPTRDPLTSLREAIALCDV